MKRNILNVFLDPMKVSNPTRNSDNLGSASGVNAVETLNTDARFKCIAWNVVKFIHLDSGSLLNGEKDKNAKCCLCGKRGHPTSYRRCITFSNSDSRKHKKKWMITKTNGCNMYSVFFQRRLNTCCREDIVAEKTSLYPKEMIQEEWKARATPTTFSEWIIVKQPQVV